MTTEGAPHAGGGDVLIDVKRLIEEYSVEELNQTAEEYFSQIGNYERLLAKPFASSNEAIHLLVQISYLLQGLRLYPGMKLLDFGAGPGWASRILNQMGLEVVTLDVSATALRMGQELARRQPVFGEQPPQQFLRFDGHRIELPDESIDRVFCLDAFHHVPNQRQALAEIGRVLRHGGIAGFAEPGPAHSKSVASQLEMRRFKVIENDIVLEDILATAKSVGFTHMTVAVGSTYALLLPFDRFRRFGRDESLNTEFVRATSDRVFNFPIFFLHKGSASVEDSREMAGLIAEIEAPPAIRSAAGAPVSFAVVIRNVSRKQWLKSGVVPGSVNVGYFVHALDDAGESIRSQQFRAHLSDRGVAPDESVTVTLNLGGLAAGRYRIDIDLVSEHVRWFQANGSKTASVAVTAA